MSLIAHYPLQGDFEDYSVNNVPLEPHGNLYFEGDTILSRPTLKFPENGNSKNITSNYAVRGLFEISSNFSYACFVKVGSNLTRTGYFFTQGRADVNSDGFGIGTYGGKIHIRFGSLDYGFDYVANTWYHIALSVDSNKKYKIFVDGQMAIDGTVGTLPDYSEKWSRGFSLGNFAYASGLIYPAHGEISDLRFYDHAISEYEVKQILNKLLLHLPLEGTECRKNLYKNTFNMFGGSHEYNHYNYSEANKTGFICKDIKLVDVENSPCGKVFQFTNSNYVVGGGNPGPYFRQYHTKLSECTELTSGDVCTFGFWARCVDKDYALVMRGSLVEGKTISSYTGITEGAYFKFTKDWNYYSITFTETWNTETSTTPTLTNCFYTRCDGDVTIQICGFKLELGNTPTPWIPNPSDTLYTNLKLDFIEQFDNSEYRNKIVSSGTHSIESTAPLGVDSSKFVSDSKYMCEGFPVQDDVPNFSIAYWVKSNVGSSFGNWCDQWCIYFKDGAGEVGMRLETWGGEGKSWRVFYNPYGLYSDGCDAFTLDDQWHHLAFVMENRVLKQYKDGTLISTNTIYPRFSPANSTGKIRVGDWSMYFNMLDFRVYGTPLTQDQIKSIASHFSRVDQSGNVESFQFNEYSSYPSFGNFPCCKGSELVEAGQFKVNKNGFEALCLKET